MARFCFREDRRLCSHRRLAKLEANLGFLAKEAAARCAPSAVVPSARRPLAVYFLAREEHAHLLHVPRSTSPARDSSRSPRTALRACMRGRLHFVLRTGPGALDFACGLLGVHTLLFFIRCPCAALSRPAHGPRSHRCMCSPQCARSHPPHGASRRTHPRRCTQRHLRGHPHRQRAGAAATGRNRRSEGWTRGPRSPGRPGFGHAHPEGSVPRDRLPAGRRRSLTRIAEPVHLQLVGSDGAGSHSGESVRKWLRRG